MEMKLQAFPAGEKVPTERELEAARHELLRPKSPRFVIDAAKRRNAPKSSLWEKAKEQFSQSRETLNEKTGVFLADLTQRASSLATRGLNFLKSVPESGAYDLVTFPIRDIAAPVAEAIYSGINPKKELGPEAQENISTIDTQIIRLQKNLLRVPADEPWERHRIAEEIEDLEAAREKIVAQGSRRKTTEAILRAGKMVADFPRGVAGAAKFVSEDIIQPIGESMYSMVNPEMDLTEQQKYNLGIAESSMQRVEAELSRIGHTQPEYREYLANEFDRLQRKKEEILQAPKRRATTEALKNAVAFAKTIPEQKSRAGRDLAEVLAAATQRLETLTEQQAHIKARIENRIAAAGDELRKTINDVRREIMMKRATDTGEKPSERAQNVDRALSLIEELIRDTKAAEAHEAARPPQRIVPVERRSKDSLAA